MTESVQACDLQRGDFTPHGRVRKVEAFHTPYVGNFVLVTTNAPTYDDRFVQFPERKQVPVMGVRA